MEKRPEEILPEAVVDKMMSMFQKWHPSFAVNSCNHLRASEQNLHNENGSRVRH
jgi:hypothetical protein